MTTHAGDDAQVIGLAKIIDESPYSDGSTALEVLNWRKNEDGILETFFRLLPLVHPTVLVGEATTDVADAFSQDTGCKAIVYVEFDGGVPEILFLCGSGVFRYTPWDGSTGINGHLTEQFYFEPDNTTHSVVPPARTYFPPQTEVIGERVYFTYCDGGGAWVWDGSRLRTFGYTHKPSAPFVNGPSTIVVPAGFGAFANLGGLSLRGRIGTIEVDWVRPEGVGNEIAVGGMDNGEWHYYALFEGVDGNYSATSDRGGMAVVNLQYCSSEQSPDDLKRRFRVYDIPTGPPGTAARILLRTPNLRRLPPGSSGAPQFLHRLPGDVSDQWIDDIPDGELGAVWMNRMATPKGFYLLRGFGGSLFLARTEANPARVWWSEQTSINGPTPESILEGAWMDVFPNTGGITCLYEVNAGTADPSRATMLVGKERATHFISGQYPDWQVGTLHNRAGVEGPNLIQTCNDGSTIWYGSRTFWRLSPEGGVVDIGEPIRKRLRRVNQSMAKMGVSFTDRGSQDIHFVLPVDDQTSPNYHFIWDPIHGGWRAGDWMTVVATADICGGLTLVAGQYDGSDNVYIWGRGSAQWRTPTNSELYEGLGQAVYQSGWVPMATGPAMHGAWNLNQLILVGEERSEDAITITTYSNWDGTNPTASTDSVSAQAHHPEDDDIPYYNTTDVSGTAPDDPAVLGTDIYRTRRPFTVNVPLNLPSIEVSSVKLTVPAGTWFGLISMAIYGPQVAPPGARTPKVAETVE